MNLFGTDRGPGAPRSSDKKIRYAVVGMGWFGQSAILPAFGNATENSALAAIVSGDEEKRKELGEKYSVPTHGYEEFEQVCRSGTIDAVYLVTPNNRHAEFGVVAARHGIHVLSEKPLEATAAAARGLVDACRQGNVKLMTAYRLHFQEANQTVVKMVHQGEIGDPRVFTSVFTQTPDAGNSRLRADLAGGPLMDIGIYCLNAARYIFRAEPTEVAAITATGDDPKFEGVPETVGVTMRFPGERVGQFTCSFGSAGTGTFTVSGTKGAIRLDPAFTFVGDMVLRHEDEHGQVHKTTFGSGDHIGPEILYFSDCILNDRDPEPDGVEGLIDLQVIEAIEESARTGRAVKVACEPKQARPGEGQVIKKPGVEGVDLVKADSPH